MRENDLLADIAPQATAPNVAEDPCPITWQQYLNILSQIGHQELSRRRAIEKAMGLPASEVARSHYRYALARLARVSEMDPFWSNAARALKTYREAAQMLLSARGRLRGRSTQDEEALARLVEDIERTETEMRHPAGRIAAPKPPGDLAFECFRLHVIRRMTYGEVAAILNRKRTRKIPEWRIARWITEVTEWITSEGDPSPVGDEE